MEILTGHLAGRVVAFKPDHQHPEVQMVEQQHYAMVPISPYKLNIFIDVENIT